ncbi:PREDICTED: extracellular superoxide dismutase [Cu-Zn] [Gavialis gangeticus]|uniref:extracellular superoxide dismutase [Cu-Zn] n=1 Tax=Gavialis gangeticus TaxID=94835 RepID=UPI00092F0F09|nr:PREDICTED: extracellular superoxide dismutase [Cu-Zn] [Gavialis gangeticus]
MFLAFCLVSVGLLLSLPGVARGELEPVPEMEGLFQELQKKVNDLWQNLLYPQFLRQSEWTAYATCEMKPSSKLDADKPQVTGQILFKQSYPIGKLEAFFDLDGLPSENNQLGRAIHIHKFGDLSDGCNTTGGHYNPFNVNHPHHPGDFGNFYSKDGKIRKYKSNLSATLFGPYTIMGRSVVIHEQEDDMGKGNNKASLENGNAGRRLACCVIGICDKNTWENKFSKFAERRKRGSQNEHRSRPN